MFDCPIWIDRKSDMNDVLCIFHLELLRDLHFEIFFEFESEKNFFVSYKWTTKITLDGLHRGQIKIVLKIKKFSKPF